MYLRGGSSPLQPRFTYRRHADFLPRGLTRLLVYNFLLRHFPLYVPDLESTPSLPFRSLPRNAAELRRNHRKCPIEPVVFTSRSVKHARFIVKESDERSFPPTIAVRQLTIIKRCKTLKRMKYEKNFLLSADK